MKNGLATEGARGSVGKKFSSVVAWSCRTPHTAKYADKLLKGLTWLNDRDTNNS